jgi:predicted permease
MHEFIQDVRYSLRSLRQSPGFAIVTILTLAVGIGANSAIFSVMNGILLKPLPYPEAKQLYRIFEHSKAYPRFPVSPADFLDYRKRNHVFESIAVYTQADLQLAAVDRPERLSALQVSHDYFHVLGFAPALGQLFTEKEEISGNEHVVVLSDGVWRRRFGADPGIVGRTITLNQQPFLVIAVMPAALQHVGGDYRSPAHGATVDAWWPFTFGPRNPSRGAHFLNAIARTKPGVSAEQAQAGMKIVAGQLAREYKNDWSANVEPLYNDVVGRAEKMLLVLAGVTGFVLLIACVNAANLMLARTSARSREMAVRAALGAGRLRLIRQALTESVILALAGGAAGALLAIAGVCAVLLLAPANLPRAHAIGVDGVAFAFTSVIALATGLLFGLAPALEASTIDLNRSLRDGGRGATTGRRQLRLRGALVISEVALASALLIGAGLLLKSFLVLQRSEPGFRPENVLTAELSLPRPHYRNGQMIADFYQRLLEKMKAVPGVMAAGAGTDIPWTGYDENTSFRIEGKSVDPNNQPHMRYHTASPDYFRAMGVPLLRGRFFDAGDKLDSRPVLIINQATASRYWPNEDPVGKRVTGSDAPKESDFRTVVGIVGDVKDTPMSLAAEPAFWWPQYQVPFSEVFLVIRAQTDPRAMVDLLRREVQSVDPDLPIADIRTLEQVANASVASPRFTMLLVALFAGVAVALAAVGTFGVMSYAVGQRAFEFGVRMALGAQRRDVLRLVILQAARLSLAGTAIGLLLALALARVLASLLYGVSPRDPVTFGAAAVTAALAGLLACYIPAWRAMRVDPMIALRCE